LYLHNAAVRENTDCLARGGSTNTEHFHQLRFRGQPIANCELSGGDHLPQFGHDLVN
jgi:hypothetical protein